ncbi:MAG: sulfite exporter TauE/SafE family protein, partial [Spirochaetia bacterium]|nr:sulfite exporter TauE/SafE family protein [Spirochaetia bacterium]
MDHLGLGALAFLGKMLAGTGIGFAIGLTGIGGGVLVMPVLTALLGLPPILAVGTSNIFNLLARSYAFTEHLRLKIIRFREAFQFLSGALPASLAGSLGLNLVLRSGSVGPETMQKIQEGLRYSIAAAIVLSLGILLITFALEKKLGLRKKPLS